MCCMQTKQAMDKSAFACLKPFLETDEPFLTDVPDSFLKGATPIYIGGKTKCVKMNETLNQWKAL